MCIIYKISDLKNSTYLLYQCMIPTCKEIYSNHFLVDSILTWIVFLVFMVNRVDFLNYASNSWLQWNTLEILYREQPPSHYILMFTCILIHLTILCHHLLCCFLFLDIINSAVVNILIHPLWQKSPDRILILKSGNHRIKI